ncbi:uncharacterized protein LOC143083100 isoform X5 [Mytilus galloprovincialis]|uniref:uncharacterized protein LOC143083100 isoform X5 n=1 Tax=Mytilus galloprovincialis TaxID=29158 RepID=UPI003F7CB799
MAADLLRERLPAHLSIGVTRDGRVFFVDDRIQTTSWLHPRTGQPVKTGHRQIEGAQGWEQAVTPEGAIYYIDHNTQITTFEHPVTRKPSNHASNKTSSSSSPPRTPTSPTTQESNRKVAATPTKVKSLKAPPAKREETNMVAMKGWLYRQESGFKSWKKRWCVLADFGLFFYKDDEEKNQIGSILLPSYKIGQCLPGESSKKYAFKAEHSNMKTYMFASDNQENMDMWINLLKSAAMLRGPIIEKEPNNNSPQKLVPKSAFMEWDEDEGSPMNKKFWTEGPDVGSPHERRQRPPENRSPDYNRSPQGHKGPHSNNRQHEPRTPDNPHSRDDKRSPGSPSSRPKIPIDKNMPKGITYDPFHGYRNDPRNNKVQEQEKASPRERYNERHRDPKQKGHRHQENDSKQRYPSDDSRQNDPRPRYSSNDSQQNDPRHQYPDDRRQNDPRQQYPNDPRQQYPNDPRQQYPDDPRQQYPNDDRQNDPRNRYPSDDSPHGPKSNHKNSPYFNSRSGIPMDAFNKYASERAPRDSRSQYPEEADRYRSRSAEKHQPTMDSSYPEENSRYGPRDSRSGYSEESEQQRRSRKRDPTDGLPAIPKEQMHNASRRHRDSDRRYERQRPKSEYIERPHQHNGHPQLDNPMLNDGRQPPHEFLNAAYGRQQEQMQKSHVSQQDLSPGRYSDDSPEKQAPRSPGYDDDSGMYDPFQTQRIYDPFHGYRHKPSPETKGKEPEVEYSKIIKVRRGQDVEQHPPEDYPYMQMNSSKSGKHPDDYITHDRLQQSMQQERKDLRSSVREGDNFGQYSPQAESRHREKQNPNRLEDPYAQSKYDRSQPQETEQKFVYSSQDNFNEEDPYHVRHNRDHLPTHEQYHPGYREPEDGYSTLTKYKDKTNGPQPQEPSRSTEQVQLSHYDTNPDLSHHTYENIHNTQRHTMEDTPNRPPLPTAVRQQIVEEIAQAKTPHTSQEILDAERNLEVRMQQPAFFNYPTPTLPPTHSHQNPAIDPRYGKPSDSMGKQYPPHRDNYHDSQSYDQGRSRYTEGLPTRGQVEEDLRMLVRPELNADPHSRYNDSGILHPHESDLLRRRLSQQKSPPELDKMSHDRDPGGDNPNDMSNELSVLSPVKGSPYVNVDSIVRSDEREMDQPSAFRPLSRNINASPRYRHDSRSEGHERSRTSQSESLQDLDETDIKKRGSVASSQVSEQSHRSINKLTGGPLRPGGKQPPKSLPLIQTVKEYPDMPDSDIIETREIPDLHAKYPALSGTRLRMSISAADLVGKTHDELVLLLIQLRREFTALEKVRNYYREQVQKKRSAEIAYRKMQQDSHQPIDPRLEGQHNEYVEMKYQGEECDKKLEVYRPIVNLVHNMVNMGSLYGGDNLMLASQYRKHLLSPEQMSPPKKMIEFSRKHQEDTIVHNMKEEVDHLKRDQVDLEEKLERLYELDRLLQEQSYKVTAFQEDKDLLEKALQGLLRQQDMVQDSSHELHHLIKQQRTVEKELSRVLYHLAQASKELEETTAENNKVEHEVALLRSKVHGELARSKSAPSLVNENMRKKMTMEKDLAKVKNIMAGLSEEGQRLSEAINTLKRSSSGGALNLVNGELDKPRKREKSGTYMETDLDTTESKDLSQVKAILSQRSLTSVPDDMNINVETAISPKAVDFIESQASAPLESMGFNQEEGPWDISDADENTKRFYGILPKERPKTLTVRDVKRQSEQRREREKIRKEIDDLDSEDPSWTSSTVSPKQEYQPIYENLPPANNAPKAWSSVNLGGSSSNNSSTTGSRRHSNLHLIAPRPFVRTYPSPTAESAEILPSKSFNFSSGLSFNDSGVVKATRVIVQPDDDSQTATSPLSPSRSQPIVKGWSPVKTNLFNVKRTPKGRYMTISSSEPVKMETSLLQPASLHSVAGDLMTNNNLDMVPDIVKSSTTKVDQMDDTSFEREVLAFPNKVLIPERYMPESDEESFTEEEKYRRQEKSDRLKKILTQQSIHSLSQPDVSNVAQEKVRRAQLLTMNQELARQVTKKSREAAAARRKTWSGIPGQIIVPDPEDSIVKEAELIDIEKYQRQENLYI